jgi:hypothetical protein
MQLPGPVRAFVGLLAVTAEEAKHLPDRAIELPMLAVSSALQASLRAQQRYARLAARGDDVLNRRPPSADPPSWATFDDPVSVDELRAVGLEDPDPALRARAASQLLDELLRVTDDTAPDAPPAAEAPARKPARKAPAKKAAPAAKKQPAKKTSAAKKPSEAKNGKTISPPRHTAPSRFDTVEDK